MPIFFNEFGHSYTNVINISISFHHEKDNNESTPFFELCSVEEMFPICVFFEMPSE